MRGRHPLVRDALAIVGAWLEATPAPAPASRPRFECTCGYVLEAVAGVDDELVSIRCPQCSGVAVRLTR